jgi:hypothetical protein
MLQPDWVKEFPASIEVCDRDGILLDVNDHAAAHVAGREMIGSNVLDCHPEAARARLAEMLTSGQANVYTIEKAGQRKLVFQAPWYVEGAYAGFVELSLPLPAELPHFVRAG